MQFSAKHIWKNLIYLHGVLALLLLYLKINKGKLRRNLKDYRQEFDAEDDAEAAGESQELHALRRRFLEE
jgi:hypothetical protein